MALCLNETITKYQVMALCLNETITEYQVMALHFFYSFFISSNSFLISSSFLRTSSLLSLTIASTKTELRRDMNKLLCDEQEVDAIEKSFVCELQLWNDRQTHET